MEEGAYKVRPRMTSTAASIGHWSMAASVHRGRPCSSPWSQCVTSGGRSGSRSQLCRARLFGGTVSPQGGHGARGQCGHQGHSAGTQASSGGRCAAQGPTDCSPAPVRVALQEVAAGDPSKQGPRSAASPDPDASAAAQLCCTPAAVARGCASPSPCGHMRSSSRHASPAAAAVPVVPTCASRDAPGSVSGAEQDEAATVCALSSSGVPSLFVTAALPNGWLTMSPPLRLA